MAVSERLSKIVSEQFPQFYKEEGANFLAFMEAYYEYLEQSNKLTDGIRNLYNYRDIATTTDDFISYFIETFLPNVPLEVVADKKLLIKYVKQQNQSRGTLRAYKLLFRVLYNESIEVDYPADQILKVSDGDWRIERYLATYFDENTYKFIGKTIKGAESGAEALVEDVIRRNIRGRDMMQILLSNIKGTFGHLEPIRIITDISATGHAPIVEAGISELSIISPGAEYRLGDIVNLVSSVKGFFGKVVVSGISDQGGVIVFNLNDGGSGYTSSTQGTTDILITGGDGDSPASFTIAPTDLTDTFTIATCRTLVGGNNIFGSLSPTITFANTSSGQINTFADMVLSSPNFGFPESGEIVGNADFRDHANAVLRIANTQTIKVGDSLYGLTSSANATVLSIVDNTASNTVVRIDGYKNFSIASGGESIRSIFANSSGNTVGTVISFSGNTIGYHVLSIGNVAGQAITAGQELVGRTSNSFGVIKSVISDTANGYSREAGGADDRNLVIVQVTANTTANVTSQFVTGPLKPFEATEGLRIVGANTTVGNVVSTTSNTSIENIYSTLNDSILFTSGSFGTIGQLSSTVGGENFSVAPTVSVIDRDISSLGIGEQYVTLQSNDQNWGTGNSSITSLDTNDRIVQSSSGASGDVKGGAAPNRSPSVTAFANGTYETTVRVWQDSLQREPNNIQFANNTNVTLTIFDSSYTPGTPDTRTSVGSGTAKIVRITDEGVLGKNAVIGATVGANGTITKVRVIDSGLAYRQGEIVTIESTGRVNASGGSGSITLSGVANGQGYYATTRSHLDSLRGFIQDSKFYQEYSYQIVSPISLGRYRDYALKLVHPAGQALYGKYRTQSNADVNIAVTANNATRLRGVGTVAINNGPFNVVGTATKLDDIYSNNSTLYIETTPRTFYAVPINIVSSNTSANLTIAWSNTSLTSANIYYYNGSI